MTKTSIYLLDQMIKRVVELRSSSQDVNSIPLKKNIIDIFYNDLIEKPIDTVRCVYDYFGLHWSKEFETNMDRCLSDNPQGKHGRNTYSLAQFGLTHENIQTSYIDYINLFPQ